MLSQLFPFHVLQKENINFCTRNNALFNIWKKILCFGVSNADKGKQKTNIRICRFFVWISYTYYICICTYGWIFAEKFPYVSFQKQINIKWQIKCPIKYPFPISIYPFCIYFCFIDFILKRGTVCTDRKTFRRKCFISYLWILKWKKILEFAFYRW